MLWDCYPVIEKDECRLRAEGWETLQRYEGSRWNNGNILNLDFDEMMVAVCI